MKYTITSLNTDLISLPLAIWPDPMLVFTINIRAFLSAVLLFGNNLLPLGGAVSTVHEAINTPCYDTINHIPPNAQIQYQAQTTHSAALERLKRKHAF